MLVREEEDDDDQGAGTVVCQKSARNKQSTTPTRPKATSTMRSSTRSQYARVADVEVVVAVVSVMMATAGSIVVAVLVLVRVLLRVANERVNKLPVPPLLSSRVAVELVMLPASGFC
jgi:hypothetical protein